MVYLGPFEWGVPGVCDGIAMYVEMRLSLPSREHIADNGGLKIAKHGKSENVYLVSFHYEHDDPGRVE